MQGNKTLAQGRYEIVGALGEGGMAYVFTAYDTRLRVERAIKVLAPRLFSNRKIRERFESEAATMAQLHHKNILTIHDIGNEDQMVYMVMEMLLGGSLMDRIEDHGVLHPQLAITAAIEMAAGLGFAHKNKVIHRDVKPHNVLISRDGIMKVADFGIARIEDGLNSQTRTGAVMGTLAYMAPEQKLSARKATARSDLYAVAASLYVMLTDDNPFELYDEEIQEEKLSPLIPEFAAFIRKGCHYDPAKRHQDADEMIAELEQLKTAAPDLTEDVLPLYIESTHKPTPQQKEARLQPMWHTMISEITGDSSYGYTTNTGTDGSSDTVDFDLFSSEYDDDAEDESLEIAAAKTIGFDSDESVSDQKTIVKQGVDSAPKEEEKHVLQEDKSTQKTQSNILSWMSVVVVLLLVAALFVVNAKDESPEVRDVEPVQEVVQTKAEKKEEVVQKPVEKKVEATPPTIVEEPVAKPEPPKVQAKKKRNITKTSTETKTKTTGEKKKKDFGFVTMTAMPMRGLTITINGKTYKKPMRKKKIPAGTHSYTIKHKDKVKSGSIEVVKGEVTRFCWNFKKDKKCRVP